MILLDHNLPPFLADYLNSARKADEAAALSRVLPAGASDEEWLAYCGERGWHAMTSDTFGNNRATVERMAARKHRVSVVVVPNAVLSKGLWHFCFVIIKAWPAIVTEFEAARAGTRFVLTDGGKPKRVKD